MEKFKRTAVILAAFLLFGLFGCGVSQEPKTLTVFAMDTVVTLTAYGKNAGPALDAAVQKLNEYDALLDVDSGDIGNINSHAGEFVKVSAEVYQLISDCVEISRQTDGAFDIRSENTSNYGDSGRKPVCHPMRNSPGRRSLSGGKKSNWLTGK